MQVSNSHERQGEPCPLPYPLPAARLAKLGPLDLSEVPDLRRYLSWVPDPRGRCGRRYSLSSLLAVCACCRVRWSGHGRGDLRMGS
jgi:hypothetical protein